MVREARKEDLNALLELYLFLHEDSIPEPSEHLADVWNMIIEDPNHHLIVNEIEGKIAYDVDASPKIDVYRKNSQTDKIIETTTVTSDEMTPTPKIPQTGLLAWPVILFTLIGVLLVAFGIMFRTTSKDNHKSGADEA